MLRLLHGLAYSRHGLMFMSSVFINAVQLFSYFSPQFCKDWCMLQSSNGYCIVSPGRKVIALIQNMFVFLLGWSKYFAEKKEEEEEGEKTAFKGLNVWLLFLPIVFIFLSLSSLNCILVGSIIVGFVVIATGMLPRACNSLWWSWMWKGNNSGVQLLIHH